MNTLKNESHGMNNNIIYSENEFNNNDENLDLQKENVYSNEELNSESNINATEPEHSIETTSPDSNDEVSNCLSLTVKKDYSLSIVKNIVVRGIKDIWRIAVSFLTLNFLKFFF